MQLDKEIVGALPRNERMVTKIQHAATTFQDVCRAPFLLIRDFQADFSATRVRVRGTGVPNVFALPLLSLLSLLPLLPLLPFLPLLPSLPSLPSTPK